MSDIDWPKGTPVRTVKPDVPTTGWTEPALISRRWDVEGQVVQGHGGHGFCYEVLHNDGTTSYYEPHELRRLDALPSVYDRLRKPAL